MGMILTRRQLGFLPYGSDDPDVIGYASLTSASDTTIGGYVGAAAGAGASAVNFTSDGVQVGTSATGGSRFEWDAALTAMLANGGHVTFWVEKGFFNGNTGEATAVALVMVEAANPANQFWLDKSTAGLVQMRYNTGTTITAGLRQSLDGLDESHVRVDLNFLNSYLEVYVNYYLMKRITYVNKPTFDGVFRLCGEGSGNRMSSSFRFKNIQFVKRPIMFAANVGQIAILGDSFVKQGQPPIADAQILGWSVDSYGDGTVAANSTNYSENMIPTCQAYLARYGLYPAGGKIYGLGRGSATVDDSDTNCLDQRIDALVQQLGGGDYPDYGLRGIVSFVGITIGTNDVAGEVASATFETKYKAAIDRLDPYVEHGIILTEIPQRYDADYEADILEKNEIIHSLADYNSKVSTIKGPFARSAADRTLIQLDGVHPAKAMQILYGKWYSEEIYRRHVG